MADPRHIRTLFEFFIATSAVLWSSHRFPHIRRARHAFRWSKAFLGQVVPDIPAATNLCSRLHEAKVDVVQGQQMS